MIFSRECANVVGQIMGKSVMAVCGMNGNGISNRDRFHASNLGKGTQDCILKEPILIFLCIIF